jgi:hypothetical protein
MDAASSVTRASLSTSTTQNPMIDSLASANGPSVTVPSARTSFAALPSASPALNTSSPRSRSSSSRPTMKPIISRIHSGDFVSIISPAVPNIMIMYFIGSPPWARARCDAGPARRSAVSRSNGRSLDIACRETYKRIPSRAPDRGGLDSVPA